MKKLTSASEYFDFEKQQILLGKFVGVVLAEKDSPENNRKAGDIIGFEIEQENGECTIAGNSYLINKGLTHQDCGVGSIVGIKFLGKTTNSKNQPVNRHEVILFDSFEEGNKYYEEHGKDAF